jgi:polar amino acid transport system substrate-binding protein
MFTIRIFIIIYCLIYGNNAFTQEITLGYVDFPPYEFQKKGKPAGSLVDLVKNIFRKANIPLKLEYLPFKRALLNTKNGKIDGLFNFYKTTERITFFDYTKPIIKNSIAFFVLNNSDIKYKKLEDLTGLKVGVLRGYTYGKNFDKSFLFRKESTNSHIANFLKLKLKRIDIYPCDSNVGLHLVRKNNLYSEFKILPTPLKIMHGYIGFTKGNHKITITKLNKVIKEMHGNRER